MRVLVVEDEPESLRSSCSFLREEGHTVDATNPAKYRLLNGIILDYDVIVVDVMSAESEGWWVLQDWRRKNASTPVLMITSNNGVADRVKGLDWGADDCLISPFALPEFGARVRALVRRSEGSPLAMITIGSLSINSASRSVTIKGNPVRLTAKEYALLEFLAVNRNELVTRSMIYQHFFDEYDPSVANSVDVYISKIRQKIGRSLITTCRGRGYIIKD